MAPRPCLGGCGAFVNGTRCPVCSAGRQRATDARRGTTAQRGYGSPWRRLQAQAVKAQPWCSDCGHRGSKANPLTGDHLRWPALTLADVEVVCRVCNSRRPNRRSGVSRRGQ